MSTDKHTAVREDVRQAFNAWLENGRKPSEYNRMYGHHLTTFEAGVLWSEATLSTREKEVGSQSSELSKLREENERLTHIVEDLKSELQDARKMAEDAFDKGEQQGYNKGFKESEDEHNL